MDFDVIVLGGGIIGASSAYELAKNGFRTALLDSYPFGRGASGNSAAMLEFQLDAHRPEPFFSLAQTSSNLFPALHQEVKKLTGIDFQYERCGILQLALNEAEAAEFKSEAARQKKLGLSAFWMTSEDLKKKIPALSSTSYGGIFFEGDGQVNGEKFLTGMLAAAKAAGAEVREDLKEITLSLQAGRVTGVETKQGNFLAKSVVIAAGAWTDQILAPLGVKLGIEPIRGQLVVYETPQNEFPFPVYTKSGGYLTPKREGYALAGTTVERAGFENAPTKEGEAVIRKFVQELFPPLSTHKVRRVTAGLRPKSPDELPIIGPLPGHDNVLIAAGHYRNGVLLAPITAQIITALIGKKKTPVAAAPFEPGRVLLKA